MTSGCAPRGTKSATADAGLKVRAISAIQVKLSSDGGSGHAAPPARGPEARG